MSVVVKTNFPPIRRVAIAVLLMQPFVMGSSAFAQSIVPTQGIGNLGTQVSPDVNNAQQLNITGGTQAAANLYHSFQQFGLTQGEIANFMSNPSIQNILARVSSGNASVINGLIQVTGGNSNLYLLNPAGIIFGANASLNVPAAFTATTANGIQVGNGWFGVDTSVDAIKNLSGNPQAFGFAANTSSSSTPQSAPVINAGNLSVNQGQSITLVGGLVINTGTIASPAGKVTIAAVADGKYVKVTPEGSLLSLELPVADQQELSHRSILGSDLPNLLTGSSEIRNLTGLNVDNSGNVLVANSPIPSTAGTAIASGNLDVSSNTTKGGEINVLGDRVGLVSANLNASGAIGGGTVLIGGDLQGEGTVPNTQYTFVSKDSSIIADALYRGNGGRVIVWSDYLTEYFGNISTKGGSTSGNGGFVEVSGKENLLFDGKVATAALNGIAGTLLIDPTDINITDVSQLDTGGNVIFQATNNINITSGIFDLTTLSSLTFIAGNNINIDGSISFRFSSNTTPTLTLIAQNGNINVEGSLSVYNFAPLPDNPGVTVNLEATNGSVLIHRLLVAGSYVNSSNTTDNIINITAQRFQLTGSTQFGYARTSDPGFVLVPVSSSIIAFKGNTSSQGKVSLQFGNDLPLVFGNSGNNLINIRLLKDTNFVVGSIPVTSGVDGQIVIGISAPAPTVLPILSDQYFSSNTKLTGLNVSLTEDTLSTNTQTIDTNNLNVQTANLRANSSQVKDCEPTGTKKQILTIEASLLPSSPLITQLTLNSSKLQPCK